MKLSERAQVLVIISILLPILFLFIGMVIDLTLILIEKQELNRLADAASKTGLIVVGDQISTFIWEVRTTTTPAVAQTQLISEGTQTPFPSNDDYFNRINDSHRATLVAPPVQTLVAAQVRDTVKEYELISNHPSYISMEIIYPYQYKPANRNLQIYLRLTCSGNSLFGFLPDLKNGEISVESIQSIRQR